MVTDTDVVMEYLDAFCSGADPGRLRRLLADDFHFEGPFYRATSADAYVAELASDPPPVCSYSVVHTFAEPPLVNVIYDFSKEGVEARVSQLFELSEGRIVHSLLIFDTADFDVPPPSRPSSAGG